MQTASKSLCMHQNISLSLSLSLSFSLALLESSECHKPNRKKESHRVFAIAPVRSAEASDASLTQACKACLLFGAGVDVYALYSLIVGGDT